MSNLIEESIQEKALVIKVSERFKSLKDLYSLPYELSKWESTRYLHRRLKNRASLKGDYEKICSLIGVGRHLEMLRTPAEDKFLKLFKSQWRIQLYPQVWIGNLCVDWFTPALGERVDRNRRRSRFKGVAIEIDGSVHNQTSKMKIDSFKEQSLTKLGIGLWRFSNEQVFKNEGLPSRLTLGSDYARLCSQDRKRLWSRIQLLTIIYHGTDELLMSYFPRLAGKDDDHV